MPVTAMAIREGGLDETVDADDAEVQAADAQALTLGERHMEVYMIETLNSINGVVDLVWLIF